MEERQALHENRSQGSRRPRVLNSKRRECLTFFDEGFGYKRTATLTGLERYTVREYLRRYKTGDISWAERGRKG